MVVLSLLQEPISLAHQLAAAGLGLLFAAVLSCVLGGVLFVLIAAFQSRQSMDPRWSDLSMRCVRFTRAAAWASPLFGLAFWVVVMTAYPRMMEQLHSIFLAPALLGLAGFALGFCFLVRYESCLRARGVGVRFPFTWGILAALGFWGAAAVLVSLCAFSADAGAWPAQPSLVRALWNPTFPATLVTWGAVSVSVFGAFGLAYAGAQRDRAWRVVLVEAWARWQVAASAVGVLGWMWWGVSLPGGANRTLVVWLAVGISAKVALGVLAWWWGLRSPAGSQRLSGCVVSVLAVFLVVACGWVLVEARGNFQIRGYVYRNGLTIEEVESARISGLWRLAHPDRPLPGEEEIGAFSFRAQCMTCHADWVGGRTPGFGVRGEAAAFIERMGEAHPAYPLFAGTSEERHALANYIEGLIARSGRALAPPPAPPSARREPESPGDAAPANVPRTKEPAQAEEQPETKQTNAPLTPSGETPRPSREKNAP